MAEPPEPSPSKTHRRSKVADGLDAATEAATAVARWTPQATLQVMCLLLLSALCAGFAIQTWLLQEQLRGQIRDSRDALSGQIRENNAQAELGRLHCAQEGEKQRVWQTAENEKSRTWQSAENEKMRKELLAAIKAGQP